MTVVVSFVAGFYLLCVFCAVVRRCGSVRDPQTLGQWPIDTEEGT